MLFYMNYKNQKLTLSDYLIRYLLMISFKNQSSENWRWSPGTDRKCNLPLSSKIFKPSRS